MSKKKQCRAKTSTGAPCGVAASESGLCFTHDPTRGAERAEARRKGGLTRKAPSPGNKDSIPSQVRSLEDVQSILDYTLMEAVALENSINRGRLLVAIAHAFIESVKVGEQEERLSAIETVLKLRKAEERRAAQSAGKGRY